MIIMTKLQVEEIDMAKREPPSDLLGALLDSLIKAKQERERRKDDQKNRRSPSDEEHGAR